MAYQMINGSSEDVLEMTEEKIFDPIKIYGDSPNPTKL